MRTNPPTPLPTFRRGSLAIRRGRRSTLPSIRESKGERKEPDDQEHDPEKERERRARDDREDHEKGDARPPFEHADDDEGDPDREDCDGPE